MLLHTVSGAPLSFTDWRGSGTLEPGQFLALLRSAEKETQANGVSFTNLAPRTCFVTEANGTR